MSERVLLDVEIDESYLAEKPDALEQGINWLRRNLAVRSVREVPAKPANEVLAEAVTACEIQAEVDGSALGQTERDHWMNVAAQVRAMAAGRLAEDWMRAIVAVARLFPNLIPVDFAEEVANRAAELAAERSKP